MEAKRKGNVIGQKSRVPVLERTLRVLAAALLCLFATFSYAYPSYEVALPNGEYIETTEDLKVKAIGGYITAKRVWTNSRWYLNPEWSDLKFTYDNLDGSVKAIDRGGAIYERSGDVFLLEKNYHIKKDGTGYRWGRQDGAWATYDNQGRITATGDRNTTHATFDYNGTGQRTAVKDAKGHLALRYTYNSAGLLESVEDRTGRKVNYTYTGDRLTKVTDVLGNDWTYTYDSQGQIETRTDPEGHKIQLFYVDPNPAGKLEGTGFKASGPINRTPPSIVTTGVTLRDVKTAKVGTYTDAENNTTTYQYQYNRTTRRYTVTKISPEGRKDTTVYDKDGRVLNHKTGSLQTTHVTRESDTIELVQDARGNTTKYYYDGSRHIVKAIYPDGSSISNTWNSYGQLLTHTDELGTITQYDYDAKGNLIKKTEAKGLPEERVTETTRDAYGQRTGQTIKGDTAAEDITTGWQYDDYGNIKEVTDAEGYKTQYAYDVMGNVTVRTDALNHEWKTEYDSQGKVKNQVTPMGNKAVYEYDKVGNQINRIDPLNYITTFAYNKNHQLIKITDPLQGETITVYDKDGRRTQDIDPDGVSQTTTYDIHGRVQQTTDAAGNITGYEYGTEADGLNGLLKAVNHPTYREEYKYDVRNRIVQTIQILAKPGTQTETTERLITQEERDARGQVKAVTDPKGRTSKADHDALGRITQNTDPASGITRYQHDKLNNLTQLTDAKGSTTKYRYNKRSELIEETRPMGEATKYQYDSIGQLTKRTDAIGNETRYVYNDDRQLTTKTYHPFSGAVSETPSQTVSNQYNAKGQLTGYQQTGDTESSATYQYDEKGRKIEETVTYGSGVARFSKTLKMDYTKAGRKKSQTYPDNTVVNYSYNAAGQLKEVALPENQSIRWESYQWQQPSKVILPGVVRTMEYDPLQRPKQIKSQQIGAGTAEAPTGDIIMDYRYSYDKAGNISQRQTEEGAYQYGYDSLDRLTQAIPPKAVQKSDTNPQGLPVEGYSYDAVHNRQTSQHQPGEWSYNQNHQLLGFGTEENKTTYTYNPLGHTAQETKIQAIPTPATKTRDYLYNAAERLAEVKENSQTIAKYQYDPFGRRISKTVNGETTYFQYSGEGLIAEYDSDGRRAKKYGWKSQGIWWGEPLWLEDTSGQGTHYYHNDYMGVMNRPGYRGGCFV